MIDEGQKTRPGWSADGEAALLKHPDIDARIELAIDRSIRRHLMPLGLTDVEAAMFARRGAAKLGENINVLPALIVSGPGAEKFIQKIGTDELEELNAQAMLQAMRIVRADCLRSAWYMMHAFPSPHDIPELAGVDHPFMAMSKAELFAYAKRQTSFDLGEREQIYPFSTDISSKAVGFGMQLVTGTEETKFDPRGDRERRTGCAMLLAFCQLHQASDWAARTLASREMNVEDPQAALVPELE